MNALAPLCRNPGMHSSNDAPAIRRDALSVWDHDNRALSALVQSKAEALPVMTNEDLIFLRVRVIALENILIAVLAEGSERQRQTARDISDALATQPHATPDMLTIRVAHHMVSVVHRACHARDVSL